jgi:putative transposase
VPEPCRPTPGAERRLNVQTVPRPPRPQFAGATYHVTARGNLGAPIFLDDQDRTIFVSLLMKAGTHLAWRCHAYCLMSNHFHLLVETKHPNLSRGMQRLNGLYAQGFNERHRRVGHLFQGRFWSSVIETDDHLAGVALYVLHNPVRAGLCELATDWPWSGGELLAKLREP